MFYVVETFQTLQLEFKSFGYGFLAYELFALEIVLEAMKMKMMLLDLMATTLDLQDERMKKSVEIYSPKVVM